MTGAALLTIEMLIGLLAAPALLLVIGLLALHRRLRRK